MTERGIQKREIFMEEEEEEEEEEEPINEADVGRIKKYKSRKK